MGSSFVAGASTMECTLSTPASPVNWRGGEAPRRRSSGMDRKVATTAGSKCVPAQRSISARAASSDTAREYGRSKVMASRASATAKMRAPERDVLAAQPLGIAVAVPALVMMVDDGHGAGEEGNVLDEPPTHFGMRPHHLPLVRREGTRLEENRIGNADLADVVEDDAVLDVARLRLGHAVGVSHRERIQTHPLGVGARARVSRRDEIVERGDGGALAAGERRQSRREQANLARPPVVPRHPAAHHLAKRPGAG